MASREALKRLIDRGSKLFERPLSLIPFTGNADANALINDLTYTPHAFVLACVMDRQIKAERAWAIPHAISEKLGGFEFLRLAELSLADVRELMSKPSPLHRFPEKMAEYFFSAVQIIESRYNGHASQIWRGAPSSAEVVYRFLQFPGVGPKIATMATNILARSLVRAMALRAQIADRMGDSGAARQWAAAVVTLWSDCDPSFRLLITELDRLR